MRVFDIDQARAFRGQRPYRHSSEGEAPIAVTHEDLARLRAVVERHLPGPQAAAAEMLEHELDRAVVLPQGQIPADIVTMRSKVVFEQPETGKRREAVLVYPEETDLARGRISVLAPVGMALLGLSKGDSVTWPLPDGGSATLRIVSVLYQPEAAGDFEL